MEVVLVCRIDLIPEMHSRSYLHLVYLNPSNRGQWKGLPHSPSNSNAHLKPAHNPQHRIDIPRGLRNPPGSNGTDKRERKPHDAPVTLHVVLDEQLRVRHQIAQQAGDHDCRDLIESQRPAGDDLPGCLET